MKTMTKIKLFEFEPTRSARCRWTLLEAGLDYKSVNNGPQRIGSDEVKKIHPLGKLPAAEIDGKPLFESAAISTAIADLVPEKNLVARPGTRGRTVHDQWVSFALTEMEAWLWPNQLNTFILPEEMRNTACLEQNEGMFKRGAAAMDSALGAADYLVEDRFTVADILAGYTLNGGRKFGYLDGFANLQGYLNRLFAREHCTLDQS